VAGDPENFAGDDEVRVAKTVGGRDLVNGDAVTGRDPGERLAPADLVPSC
jgi:hypothetical protein